MTTIAIAPLPVLIAEINIGALGVHVRSQLSRPQVSETTLAGPQNGFQSLTERVQRIINPQVARAETPRTSAKNRRSSTCGYTSGYKPSCKTTFA